MKRQSSFSDLSPFRWLCALALSAAMLFMTAQFATANSPATSHGVVTYGFQGRVTAVEPGSRIFPGASVGAPVLGQFTIDYDVTGTPSSLELRTSGSPNFRFSGLIGGQAFASASTAYQSVSVGNNTIRDDFVTLNFPAGVPTTLERLVLEFIDSRGFAITEPILPASAAAFNAFPTVVLSGFSNVWMGSYSIDVSIFPIPLNTIEFLHQPSNTVVFLNSSATFSLEARATVNGTNFQGLAYQWQRLPANGENWLNSDWINVQGATNSSYTTPPIETPAPGNPSFRCAITAGEATAFSSDAILTVERDPADDCPPLTVTAVSADSQRQQVTIEFSLPISPMSAVETFNYILYNPATLEFPPVVLVSMRDARTVVIETFDIPAQLQPGATYELLINDVWYESHECFQYIARDTKVRFTVPTCPQITRQPRSRTVSEDCAVTLEVTTRRTDGSRQPPLHYQWFKNNQAIAGATNSTYTAAPIQVADSGATFHAEVSSTCATLVSSNAVLTVTTDTIPLNLDSAEPGLAPNSIVLSFSSPCGTPDGRLVAQLASNQLNYNWSGDIFSTRAYVDCTGTNVIVFTTPQQPGKTYTVTVQNLADTAGNLLENGGATATFTAPERTPVPFGILRTTTLGNQTLLEWAADGLLQMADLPSGPWTDVTSASSPYLVTPSPFPCTGDSPPPSRYYRVRWGAQ